MRLALERSAERAIPISANLLFGEFFVDCVLAATDCTALDRLPLAAAGHVCSRISGTCVSELGDCQYGSEPCTDAASCSGQQLSVCLRGARATIEAPALCPAS
jgi:hypothetical protein